MTMNPEEKEQRIREAKEAIRRAAERIDPSTAWTMWSMEEGQDPDRLGYDVPVLSPSDAAGGAAELKQSFERHATAP